MPDLRKAGGVCGIAIPAVAFTAILTSIALSPWFSWNSNALSDLGNYSRSGAAVIFNTGILISGAMTVIFGLGVLRELSKSKLGKAGSLALTAAGAALACIGIFSEDAGAIHFYVSVAFFSLFPISLLILGPAMILRGSGGLGAFSISIAVLAALPWAFSWRGVAIPETISAAFASVWGLTIGTKMLKSRNI
ncbi:MAG: DUF998 domain-containing protein [Candidatus Hadarchaeales archaeon]